MEFVTIGGVPFVTSEILTVREVPMRKHRKRCGSAAYHRRIQKKWNKRFGVRVVFDSYKLPDGTLVVHPVVLRRLQQVVADGRLNDAVIRAAHRNANNIAMLQSLMVIQPAQEAVWSAPIKMPG